MRLIFALAPIVAGIATTTSYTLPADLAHYCNGDGVSGPPELPPKKGTVVQSHVFVRHGARTVSAGVAAGEKACWPGQQFDFECSRSDYTAEVSPASGQIQFRREYMPGRNKQPNTCATGQLVHDGFEMHKNIGKALRERYVGSLLPHSLRAAAEQVHLRSDEEPRVIQSAQTLFASMYASSEGDASEGETGAEQSCAEPFELTWHIMDSSYDSIMPERTCFAKFSQAKKKAMETDDYKREYAKRVTATQQKINPIWAVQDQDLGYVCDCMFSTYCPTVPNRQREVPTLLTEKNWELMRDAIRAEVWEVTAFTTKRYPEAQRYSFGPFIRDLVANIKNGRAFHLYGGHDTGPLLPLLAVLDVVEALDYPWPQFASTAVLEIYTLDSAENKHEEYVRFIFEGKDVPLPACGGAPDCKLSKLLDWFAPMIPTEAECPSMGPAPAAAPAAETVI